MRYNGAYSLTLATRALASALLFFLVCEAGHVCFEVYATQVRPSPPSSRGDEQAADDLSLQPMTVSQFASNPNQALLSGLRSSNPYFKVRPSLPLSLRRRATSKADVAPLAVVRLP